MTQQEESLTTKRRMGIYALELKECGCRVKEYIGGKVVIEACKEHVKKIYYQCPSCGKRFDGKSGKGKSAMKECAWSHAI